MRIESCSARLCEFVVYFQRVWTYSRASAAFNRRVALSSRTLKLASPVFVFTKAGAVAGVTSTRQIVPSGSHRIGIDASSSDGTEHVVQ